MRLVVLLALLLAACPRPPSPELVLWWKEDGAGRLAQLLVVGPGSPPRSDALWVHYLFNGQPAPGHWAHLNITTLEPLSASVRTATARQPAQGSGSLQQIVLAPDGQVRGRFERVDDSASGFSLASQEAVTLLAQRLADPTVARTPTHGGVWMSRLHIVEGHVVLDVAPTAAPETDDANVSFDRLGMERPRFGVEQGSDTIAWCDGDVEAVARTRHHVLQVQLDKEPPAKLPATTWEWPVTVGDGAPGCVWKTTGLHVTRQPGQTAHLVAEMRIPLRECNFAVICERWHDRTFGVPLGIMRLRASLLH